jgi:hypothetical protein
MEKPSGTPFEDRRISTANEHELTQRPFLLFKAGFLGSPKIGRDIITVLLGLILAAGASGQQVAAFNPTDSDKEPISKAV